MTEIIACVVVLLLTTAIGVRIYLYWMLPPSEHQYEIQIVERKHSVIYPYQPEIYRDGEKLKLSSHYMSQTKAGALKQGYKARKNDIKAYKFHKRFNEGVTEQVVIPARKSKQQAKHLIQSSAYAKLRNRYAKNELTQEEFEREIGKLLIEEEKKEAA